MNNFFLSFDQAIQSVQESLRDHGRLIDAAKWQSINVPQGVRFLELTNTYFTVSLEDTPNLQAWVSDIKPNIPWADTAFEERVAGIPWNPGKAWESWPYARSAANFKQDRFSHSYAERYWPKTANSQTDQQIINHEATDYPMHKGIRFMYGDLYDVAELMSSDPMTRQAYLPVWFPEDTGVVHGTRVPCSLGYHFMFRDGAMSITYYIRSCDFVRHFRDDLYMTLRLLMWMIDRMPFKAVLGDFIFHCGSLHCFESDLPRL